MPSESSESKLETLGTQGKEFDPAAHSISSPQNTGKNTEKGREKHRERHRKRQRKTERG
jgi:hypothetical protein